MRAGLICHRTDRRRTAQGGDNQRRGSFAGINDVQLGSLAVPGQSRRRNSLNTLTGPYLCERRGSCSGPSSGKPADSRRKLLSRDKFGFNPLIDKLNKGHVRKILTGLVLLFVIVLLISLLRILT